jgi:AcrR family transcriptional regulator
MPKIVDHAERRSELCAAVWRLASRDGLEAVTLRAVAAEAGWSTGALNHYFSDKEELLLFAFEIVADRSAGRLAVALEAPPGPGGGLRELIAQLLPLDAERRAEVRVWFALLGLALTRPALARAQRDAYRGCRALMGQTLRAAQERGEIDPELDPERQAAELVAFADGLAVQATFDPRAFSPARQLEILDERLAALSSGKAAATR